MSPSDQSDHDLLRQYAREGSEAAFAELVRRHLNLVYSAALRQVRSAALAEEIAQSVFLDLSRGASGFPTGQPLVAWLHVVTRRTAIDVVRRESRRQAREHQAAEIAAFGEQVESAMKTPSSEWDAVEPLLDEAVESLNEPDRAAILLRYFENKSLREVGAALGASEDAAQKRVSRAVEQLRGFFLRRGVAVTAAGLAADLSAHALQIAPATLGAVISTSAASTQLAASASALHDAAQTLTMTITQKTLVVAALTLALGGSLYEARVILRQNAELQTQQQRSENFQRELRAERDDNTGKLAAALQQLEAERAKASANALASADPAMESALDSWLQNVTRLKQRLEQMPAEKIPELQFLTAKDWLAAAKDLKIDSDLDARRALGSLRFSAKQRFAPQLAAALKRYLEANNNQPPAEAAQLAAHFDSPVDPAVLLRYGAPTPSEIASFPRSGEPYLLAEKGGPVDDYYDSQIFFVKSGMTARFSVSKFGEEVAAAIKAFQSANNNQRPTDPVQLTPYLHSAIDPAFVRQRLGGK